MSISSVALDPSAGTSGWRSSIRQAGQDFNQLVQALQSGDLAAAQQAYGSFQQIQAGQTSVTTPASTVAATTTTNPVASDWSAMGQALQSGSLSSAQGALGQLQQDAQSAWQTRLQQQAQNAQAVYALMQSPQGATAASGTAQAPGTAVQNDLNALSQALQSGDSASAQTLLAQLQQDLQTSGQYYGGHHHHHHGHPAATAPTAAAGTTSPGATTATGSASGSGTGTAA